MSRYPQASRERALTVVRALGTAEWSGRLQHRTPDGRTVELRRIAFVEADGDRGAHIEVWAGSATRACLRVFNPPTLVADPSGPIVSETVDPLGRRRVRRLRHDPIAALAELVAAGGGGGRRRRRRRGVRR